MQLEVGSIFEGKVTGITKFGAFVELPGGKTGMVHISEVAPTYVKEIRDFLTENQEVKVKVLSISEDGKVSLSIKKAMEPPAPRPRPQQQQQYNRPQQQQHNRPQQPRPSRPGGFEWQHQKHEPANFEDMMSKFKQQSDEKFSDLKRGTESRRGGYSRRGNGNQQK